MRCHCGADSQGNGRPKLGPARPGTPPVAGRSDILRCAPPWSLLLLVILSGGSGVRRTADLEALHVPAGQLPQPVLDNRFSHDETLVNGKRGHIRERELEPMASAEAGEKRPQ